MSRSAKEQSQPLHPSLVETEVLAAPRVSVDPEGNPNVGHQASREDGAGAAFLKRPGAGGTTENERLLQSRLAAVFLILLLAFGMYFIRNLFLDALDLSIQIVHVTMIFVLLGSYLSLSKLGPLPLSTLRGMEYGVFGLILVFLIFFETRLILLSSRADDSVEAIAKMKDIVHDATLIVVLYGLFIPNTWKRAALVVLPYMIALPLTSLLLRLFSSEVRSFMARVVDFERITDNFILLVMGSIIALYGAHVIHCLRLELKEASQVGQYRLRKLLGSGGMGQVYLADHQFLKRPAAIKIIKPEAAGERQSLARFELEVQATACLSHPNTIEIYDYGRTDDGTFYYVMEYLQGMTLEGLVEHHGAMPPGRAIYFLRQACGALIEAHGVGLIHRDLKPANMFAAMRGGQFDVVKLLDFGLVKPVGPVLSSPELSGDGSVRGSPLYMSPEQAMGRSDLDPCCDLYAMGGVAYFLLTGKPPFQGDTAMAVMVAHVRDQARPPSLECPGIPADLERVVMRCLAKKREARYQTALELEEALAACEDAGSWDSRKAAEWWRSHVPELA